MPDATLDLARSASTNPWRSWPRGNAIVGVAVTNVWISPDAPRDIDGPIVSDSVEPSRWLARLDNSSRLDLLDRLATQALLGEPVRVIRERSGWSEIRLPWQPTTADENGYPGWVRSAHLVEDRLANRDLFVQRERLCIADGRVLSIGMTHGWERRNDEPAGPSDFDALVEQFLGLPYLWGGLSGWGVDCSGLVHLCARAMGLLVPRDSIDLYSAIKSGTLHLPLLFFRHADGHLNAGRIRHVAVDLGRGSMVHAPRTGSVVEVITTLTPPYDDDRVR